MGRGRVKLTEVNPHLVCVLCRGYLIDATTITECLHSFCRSCIILYLERKSYCPICEVQIHKTKPYLNLKLDKTLQDIVYKLVPGLFHNEMKRRQEFYKSHPLHDRHLHPEARGIANDRLIYSPDDSISLSLEYYDKQREREEWTSVGDTSAVATHGAEGKRYLLCPAVVTMAHLKKFLRSKYNLPDSATVEVLYRRESLPDTYSLMDVAYIYTWKQNEPMRFYYRIHLLTKCIRSLPELESIEGLGKEKIDNTEEISKTHIESYKDFLSNKFTPDQVLKVSSKEEKKKTPIFIDGDQNLSLVKNKSSQSSREKSENSQQPRSNNGLAYGILNDSKNTTNYDSNVISTGESNISYIAEKYPHKASSNSKNPVSENKKYSENNIENVPTKETLRNIVDNSVTRSSNEVVASYPNDNNSREAKILDDRNITETSLLKITCDKNVNITKKSQISKKPDSKSQKSSVSSSVPSEAVTVKDHNSISKGALPNKPLLPNGNVPNNLLSSNNNNNNTHSSLLSSEISSKNIHKETSKIPLPGNIVSKSHQFQRNSKPDVSKTVLKCYSPSNSKTSSLNKFGNKKMCVNVNSLAVSKMSSPNPTKYSEKKIVGENKLKTAAAVVNPLSEYDFDSEDKNLEEHSPKYSSERVPARISGLMKNSPKSFNSGNKLKISAVANSLTVESYLKNKISNKSSAKSNSQPEISSKISDSGLSETIQKEKNTVNELKPSSELNSFTKQNLNAINERKLSNPLNHNMNSVPNDKLSAGVESDKNPANINNNEPSSLSDTKNQEITKFDSQVAEKLTELDESASELLSAIGLQPKSKLSPVKVDSEANANGSQLLPEKSIKDLSKKESDGSEFLVPGFKTLKPFRSVHDEMSVSLLLGLSKGHFEEQPINEPKTEECSNANQNLSPSNPKTLVNAENNSDEFSSINSPINNIQKVVNNIVPSSKNIFKPPQNKQTREKKTDLHNKNLSAINQSLPTKINGFKVPQSPVLSDKSTVNGIKTVVEPKVVPMKNSMAANDKTYNSNGKVLFAEKPKIIDENGYLNDSDSSTITSSLQPVNRPFQHTKAPPKPLSALGRDVEITPNKHLLNTMEQCNEKSSLPEKNVSQGEGDNFTSNENKSATPVISEDLKENGGDKNANVIGENKSLNPLETEGEVTVEKKCSKANPLSMPSESGIRSISSEPPTDPRSDVTEQADSKVNILKRKLNSQPNECDVIVSAATRDDSLTEAKKRKQVTPDVSIELLSGPLNERSSVKRPLFEYPNLTKKIAPEKHSVLSNESNHTEIRISKIDQLCASSVKIEKISSSHLNNINVKSLNKEKHTFISDSKPGESTPELRSCTPKSDCSESRSIDDSVTPDITIEKMRESPKLISKKTPENNCEIKVTKVTDVSATMSQIFSASKRKTESPFSSVSDVSAVKSLMSSINKRKLGSPSSTAGEASVAKPQISSTYKRKTESPSSSAGDISAVNSQISSTNKRKTESPSSSVSDTESPSSTKKLPRLIEINAPPRPKLDPTFQERKNQRTGLKMTTVRKEVPIGKEVPLVRKDSNGALDLSGKSLMKPSPSTRPPSLVPPSEMFPATALHHIFRHQLELQSRLLASHNLGRDWRKDPVAAKHLEDWVRNAVSCGALPPHPLMFNPTTPPPSPHRK